MLYRQNLLLAAVFIVISELLFASMGAAVKAVSAGLPNEMVVFFRNAIGLLLIAPLLLRGGLFPLRTERLPWHLLRAGLGLSAMYCFFFALANLPLAEGVLLKMTAPIFMPLIALFLLAEVPGRFAVAAVAIGFAGVALVLDPGGEFNRFALIGLLGGALAAMAKVTVRRLGRTEPTLRVVFYFSLLATLISAVPMSWAWQMPTPNQWGLLLLLGAMGTAGQLLLSRAYALAPVAHIGPFTYSSVLFAALFGYLLWGETIGWHFIAGAGLIAAAGLLALYRPRRRLLPTGERAEASARP
jgi:drug/metabolite transporter (DMT)-like permease